MRFLTLLVVFAATCSVANANGQQEEIFFGQSPLSVLLNAAGGFKGKLFLHNSPNGDHGKNMLSMLTKSVPRESILTHEDVYFFRQAPLQAGKPDPNFSPGFYDKEERKKLEDGGSVRVIHMPTVNYHMAGSPGTSSREGIAQILKNHDILIVCGAGNFSSGPHLDIYQPGDPYWGSKVDFGRITAKVAEYHEIKQFFQSGHAIMAAHVVKKPETLSEFAHLAYGKRSEEDLKRVYQNSGEYIRHPLNVRFGDLKEYGFTVLFGDWNPGTSVASAHVAAFAFYLYQLWDTTAEVLEVMQKTAIDIGESGVDEEFGWGLINANHPIIWNRAAKRLEESLQFCLLEDVAFEQTVTAAKENLDVFHHIDSGKKEIGLTFRANETTMAFATGAAVSPFGLSSQFLQQQSTITQVGVRHRLTESISVVGIYGRSKHEDFSVNKGSIGAAYQKHFSDSSGNLSLYVGHRSVWGSIGFLGYRALAIAQTPFTMRMVEARASLSWLF